MPMTFPSHAAAVLPLMHLPWTRRLLPSAWVIGSIAPDLTYLVGSLGRHSHEPWGLLSFCLPAGLLAFVYWEALVMPAFAPLISALLLHSRWQFLRKLCVVRPLPVGWRAWLGVLLAIVLGSATHQLWDGFTHAWMWPANWLYPGVYVAIGGRAVLLTRVLQHGSTLVGALIVWAYVWWVVPSLKLPVPPEVVLPAARKQLLRLLGLPALGALLTGVGHGLLYSYPLCARAIWEASWAALDGFFVLLGALISFDVYVRKTASKDGRKSTDQYSL